MHLSETPDARWLYNEKFTIVFFLFHWHIDFVFIFLMHGSPTCNKWGPGILQKKCKKGYPGHFGVIRGRQGGGGWEDCFRWGYTTSCNVIFWGICLLISNVNIFHITDKRFCSCTITDKKLFGPFCLVGLTFI